MIRRTSKFLAASALVSFAAYSNAGSATVSPALAACSKALIETITKAETLPAYTVKSPSPFVSDLVDKNSFTVLAHNTKTKELLGKASCKATPAGEIVSFKQIYVKS
jgi:hypothetical protein